MILSFLLACTAGHDDSSSSDDCSLLDPDRVADGNYQVAWSADPTLRAASTSDFRYQVLGPDGTIVEDLQQSHERMVHVLFISRDLESFQHVHHEDFFPLEADTLRCGHYHLQETPPTSGPYRIAFDFAHQNRYLQTLDWAEVSGDVPQLTEPEIEPGNVVEVDGLHIELTWDVAAVTGFEAQWSLYLTEAGEDVTDLVQWLGADAHAVVATEDAMDVGHTHAWVPGIDNMMPGMQMPHEYPGPYLPFHFTFPSPGWHKMWVQFARAADPETPYTVAFWFEVAP